MAYFYIDGKKFKDIIMDYIVLYTLKTLYKHVIKGF